SGETAADICHDHVAGGKGGSHAVKVTVTIHGQNDAPVAANDATDANENGPAVTVDVLANDTDADSSDTLAVDSVDTTGTLGTVTDRKTTRLNSSHVAISYAVVGETT